MIKIEHGVSKQNGMYRYEYWTAEGLDDTYSVNGEGNDNLSTFHVVHFTAENGEVPEIGDFINNNVLQKRDGIQVTEGKMKWPSDNEPRNTADWETTSLDGGFTRDY